VKCESGYISLEYVSFVSFLCHNEKGAVYIGAGGGGRGVITEKAKINIILV
jgi:hypothetical protein